MESVFTPPYGVRVWLASGDSFYIDGSLDQVEALLQGLPWNELHYQVRQRFFPNPKHLHNILVANLGGCTRLPQETLARR